VVGVKYKILGEIRSNRLNRIKFARFEHNYNNNNNDKNYGGIERRRDKLNYYRCRRQSS